MEDGDWQTVPVDSETCGPPTADEENSANLNATRDPEAIAAIEARASAVPFNSAKKYTGSILGKCSAVA